jgi:hypothetical protein
MYGITVVVVDGEDASRTSLLWALRRLGLRALGVDTLADATALLEALDADAVLVHADEDEGTLAPLRARTSVVQVPRAAPVDEVVVELLRALGRPEAAATLN